MDSTRSFALIAGVSLTLLSTGPLLHAEPRLEEVAEFPDQQVTGVTVTEEGRLFVNFPYWSPKHTTSVAEVIDGKPVPYPSQEWNDKEGAPDQRWICVQSVVADNKGSLWVLDPAAPMTEGIVKGGPKLVQIDLKTNGITKVIAFDEQIAPEKSYLNDVRINTANDYAYITESGTGALIVVDLKTNKARRLLANHPSTKVEPDAEIVVDGMKLTDPKTGKAPAFHADGIALDDTNGWLYFHALTAKEMYRIKTEDLRNPDLSDDELAKRVEKMGATPKPDGMLESKDGTVYLAAFEENAIAQYDPSTKQTAIVFSHLGLQWPDTLSWGPDGAIYVTTSQIHRMPKYHNGESLQQGPYRIFRIVLDPVQN